MPIEKIKIGETTYYRWGKQGKWYRRKEDALKQMRAIKASQERKKRWLTT